MVESGQNWDHDACVNDPVSGAVWGDVLRNAAVWHMRLDVNAPRMERVCKAWQAYWQVAEGIFDIDVRAGRIEGIVVWPEWRIWPMSMKDLKQHRERARLHQLAGQFQIKGVGALATAVPRLQRYEDALAEQERDRLLAADQAVKRTLHCMPMRSSGLMPPPPTVNLSEFLASRD
jgi:hypothetical protein